MAAPPAILPAAMVAGIAALQGLGFVTQADLQIAVAPLATQAQLQAMQAQLAQLPTLVQIQALLAQYSAPAIAATAAANVQAICVARAENAHDRSAVPYAVVPRADGTPPPAWPAGFDRDGLRSGPMADVNALLLNYGLPPGGSALVRRNVLALHIGTMRL